MASASDSLALQTRANIGTTGSRALRAAGHIPGILYGHGKDAVPIAIDTHAFEALLHAGGRNHLLTVSIDGGPIDTALVRDVQRDPISRRVVHADLQRVSRTEAITATLTLVPTGAPIGVKDFGGVLDIIQREIEVSGPADSIPENFSVDVSHLGIHEHVTAGDVVLPKGFTLLTPPDAVVISVEAPRTAEPEAAAPAAEAGAAEAPVVGATPEGQS